MDLQVQELFTIWAANKTFLDGFVFREWNHNQFCLIHRDPIENPPWNGNPDCWNQPGFFYGHGCPSFQWNCCENLSMPVQHLRRKKRTEASVSYALCYFWRYPIFMPHGKKTSKNDSLLGPMVIFTPWEQKESLYSYWISRCSFACLIHRTSQHQG